jgi:hypothetical protein
MITAWPFNDPPNLAVITLRRITRKGAPILLVSHDKEDGGWQFLDGQEVAEEDASVVSLLYITRIDPSILQLTDLPLGWTARRSSSDDPWHRGPAA